MKVFNSALESLDRDYDLSKPNPNYPEMRSPAPGSQAWFEALAKVTGAKLPDEKPLWWDTRSNKHYDRFEIFLLVAGIIICCMAIALLYGGIRFLVLGGIDIPALCLLIGGNVAGLVGIKLIVETLKS